MSTSAGSAVGYLDLDVSGFLAGLRTAQSQAQDTSRNIVNTFGSSLQSVGTSITSLGTMLTLGVTTPILGAGASSLAFASTFETAMAKVTTIADATSKPIEELEREILELSESTGESAAALAEATYQAISAGVETADSVAFVAEANRLAIGGFSDSVTTVDLLTTVMNAYGYEVEDVEHLSNVLISTQNKGKTTVDQLASSLGRVIPIANSMNVGFEDLSTSTAFLTAQGIETSEAATLLKSAFSELGKGGTDVSNILLEETGKSFQQLMDEGYNLRDVLGILQTSADESGQSFTDLFGSQEAATAALSIVNVSTEEYANTLADFQSTSGDAEQAFNTMADTMQRRFSVALESGKGILIEVGNVLGELLLPYLEQAIGVLQTVKDSFVGLTESQQKMVILIAGILAALGPVLIAFGTFVRTIGSLITLLSGLSPTISNVSSFFTLLSGKITALAPTIGKLIASFSGWIALAIAIPAAFVSLITSSDSFRDSLVSMAGRVKDAFGDLFDRVQTVFNMLKPAFEQFTTAVGSLWTAFTDLLGPYFIFQFNSIVTNIELVLGIITSVFDIFIGLFTGNWQLAWDGVKNIFLTVWGAIVSYATGIFTFISSLFTNVLSWVGISWQTTWESVKTFFVNVWDSIVSSATSFAESTKETFVTFIDNVILFFSNLPYNVGLFIGETLGSIISWGIDVVNNARETGTMFLENIVSFFIQLPGRVKTFLSNTLNEAIIWATNFPQQARTSATNFLNNVVNIITNLPTRVREFLSSALNAVVTWGSDLSEKGRGAINQLIDSVVSAGSGMFDSVMSIGSDIINGVWQGFQNASSSFTSNIRSFFSGIVDGVKSELGISSPSKVFGDEVGRWILPGVLDAFNKSIPDAKKEIQDGINKVSNVDLEAATNYGIFDLNVLTTIDLLIGKMIMLRDIILSISSIGVSGGFSNIMLPSNGTTSMFAEYNNITNEYNFSFNGVQLKSEVEMALEAKKAIRDLTEGF